MKISLETMYSSYWLPSQSTVMSIDLMNISHESQEISNLSIGSYETVFVITVCKLTQLVIYCHIKRISEVGADFSSQGILALDNADHLHELGESTAAAAVEGRLVDSDRGTIRRLAHQICAIGPQHLHHGGNSASQVLLQQPRVHHGPRIRRIRHCSPTQ